ncbi:MAG TPA: ATP-binding protein [Verrucomicrobiae bacterium]|jgi:signal transduction histidine kinase|nr:ATP-binding protein [Verrucomicrobiae bacterium]
MKSSLSQNPSAGASSTGVLPLNPEPHFFASPDNFIEFALDSVLALVQAHAGSLMLWDEEKKALVLKSARGPYCDRVRDAHIRLREGVAGWVGDKGRSVLVKDIHDDSQFSHYRRAGNYETHSFMSIPLISSNKLVGVINITERANFDAFTEDDMVRARLFAQHIAIAYDNMRLASRFRVENQRLSEKVVILEQTLERQEPLVSIGKLASNLAHELNNPLDSIRRYVNLALEQVMEDSLARQYIMKSKEGIRRAIQVIRGLLQYSRHAAKMELRESELHQVLRKSLEGVSHDDNFEGVHVRLELAPEECVVPDCGLAVVFRNLFKNAYQAMKGRGTLKISTSIFDTTITVKIQDSGCGVPDAVKTRLFEPFFSTKQGEGTGIGLAISREIVEKCGGSIQFESMPEIGTTFIIHLPLLRRA